MYEAVARACLNGMTSSHLIFPDPFSRTPLHSFLTIDQLAVAYPKTLDILKPETIFPNVTYHSASKFFLWV